MVLRLVKTLCLAWLGLIFGLRTAAALDVVVSVAGEQDALQNELEAAALLNGLAEVETTTPQEILAAARADYANLIGVLYSNGYYGGTISIRLDGREAAELSSIAPPPSIDRVDLRINPGPLFAFSEARIGPLAPGDAPPKGFALGKTARSDVIVDAAKQAVSGWRDQAHAKARVTGQSITADHRGSTLSAKVTIDPGPRLTFGELNITENGNVRPERIRQIADLPIGRPFSPDDLKTSSERLRRTGAFNSVVLEEAEEVGQGNTLDVNASLQAAKPRRIGFGAEIASLEGLSITAFWLHRNLFGGAERLRLDFEVGGIGGESGGEDFLLSARYERPATFSADTDLFLSALIEQDDEPEFRERRAVVEGGLLHRFSEDLVGEIGLGYQLSDIDDALGSRTLTYLLFPARLTYDTREDELDPHQGYFADLEVTPLIGLDGDSDSGVRVFADLRSYLGFGESNGVVLAGRVQIGSVIGPGISAVPPGMLFFSGGAGTVRGQDFQELGVELPNGEQIGGRSFLGLSLELRTDVSTKWSLVSFVDAGFIGEDSFSAKSGDTHAGAGFGIRYNTGLGPIRFDVGTPLDDDAGSNFEIYVGIGQAF